tara:strand:+ start:311 stop:1618 length:1308 start_codon:yes stop_codon:yes gene_type:complete
MGVRLSIYFIFCFSFFISTNSLSQINHYLNFSSDSLQLNFFNKLNSADNNLNISLLLPFCLEKNEILSIENLDSLLLYPLERVSLYKKTRISLDFYLGFLLSLNQFEDVNINISVFDIKEGDISRDILKEVIKDRTLNHMDLIIGPLFTDNFLFFKNRFNKNIPLISPFSKKPHITLYNQNVFQLPVDLNDKLSTLSEYIFTQHMNDNIILIRRDTLFKSIKNRISVGEAYSYTVDTILTDDIFYGQKIIQDIDTSSFSFEEIRIQANVIDSIHHKLDTLGKKNIIIIPSQDNVFVTDLLSKLHACRDTSMVVYGMPNLSSFDHISVYDLMDLKLTFPHNQNYNYSEINKFIIDFYDSFNYVPNLNYATIGYEMGTYFLEILIKNGSILSSSNKFNKKIILGRSYEFQKENSGGYKNKAVTLFRYDNFGYLPIYE